MIKNIMPPSKNDEKVMKEEEDNYNTVFNFNITLEDSKIYEHLDYYVQGIYLNKTKIDTFDGFLQSVNELIEKYKEDSTELGYRYKKYCEKNKIEQPNKGNIGLDLTTLLLINQNFNTTQYNYTKLIS